MLIVFARGAFLDSNDTRQRVSVIVLTRVGAVVFFRPADAISGLLQRCKYEKRGSHGGVRVRRYEDGAREHRGGRQVPPDVAILILASVLIIINGRQVQQEQSRAHGARRAHLRPYSRAV